MVSNITSLTGNGLKDWLIQRLTAVYFAAYCFFLVIWFALHPQLQYEQWQGLFSCVWVQVATVIALLSFSLHAWIGIWTVTTDYVKCNLLRVSLQSLIALWLLGQFVWGLMIIWGQ